MITITVEGGDRVLQVLNNILTLVKDPKDIERDVGKLAVASIKNRIQVTKTDPNGVPWRPMAVSTIQQRMRKGTIASGLLNDTGGLLNSISFQQTNDGLAVVASAAYATYLQNGTTKMPARPFMGWSNDDKANIINIINTRLNEAIK
jgi:phage virion morphogenesis protein